MKNIQDLVQMKFPTSELVPLVGGGTNLLFLLMDTEVQTVVKVAMISNNNAKIEQACLCILNESSLAPVCFAYGVHSREDTFR